MTPSVPSCAEPDTTNGGVVLTSIALKSDSAASFIATVAWRETQQQPHLLYFFFIIIFKLWYQIHLCVTDLPSTAWNYADKYNLPMSSLNNLWMSAWTVCITHLLTCPSCLIGTMRVHIHLKACLQWNKKPPQNYVVDPAWQTSEIMDLNQQKRCGYTNVTRSTLPLSHLAALPE